jgi:hypothetical protein
MSDETRRILIKRGEGTPTIPETVDHRDGTWTTTDIYEGEFYLNLLDDLVYTRTNDQIINLSEPVNVSFSKIQHQVKYAESITKGQAVYVSGSNGVNMIVSKASNSSESTSSKTMGLVDGTGATNAFNNVVTEGLLGGLNTVGATAGDPVWLGTSGNLIYGLVSKPVAPAHLVFIGIVTRVNATLGEIFVKVQNGFELQELHNVLISSVADNDIIYYDSATSLWKNKQLTSLSVGLSNVVDSDTTTTTNITDATDKRFVTENEKTKLSNTSNTNSGDETNGTIKTKLGVANGSNDGYLSASDYTTFTSLTGSFIPSLPVNNYPNGYAANNGSATLSIMGNLSAAALSGTAAAVSIAATNTLTRTVRVSIPTAATAGSKSGIRSATLRHSVGQGFLFSVGWAIQDAAFVTGSKQFHGLLPISTLSTISNLVNVESLMNFVGIGSDATDTNLQIFHNDGVGTATKIDLGVNFPANRTAGAALNNYYIFDMYNEPNTSTINYRITERSTGNTAQGTISTHLPTIDTLLGIQCIRTNGITALAQVTHWSHLIAYTI